MATQPPQAQSSQAYGQKTQQIQAQQEMPLPMTNDPAPPDPSMSGPTGPNIVELARAIQPPTPLTAPSERPYEPVTAGMMQGAGPGPEAIANFQAMRRNQAADMLDTLAQITGDPDIANYARRAREHS